MNHRFSFSRFAVYCICVCSVAPLIQAQDEDDCHRIITAREGTILPSWQSVLSDESSSSSKNTVIRLFGRQSRKKSSFNGENDEHEDEEDDHTGSTSWILHSTDGVYQNISAHVPGDLLTDLMKNGIIEDPYYGRNWLTQRRIWMGPLPQGNNDNDNNNNKTLRSPPIPRNLEPRTRTWVYTTTFRLVDQHQPASSPYSLHPVSFMLVIEEIKMGAMVSLNGVTLIPQNVTDQFLRYILPLPPHALERGESVSLSNNGSSSSSDDSVTDKLHTLTVTFDPTIATNGRFMACSGGWDWAPYSRTGDERGSRTFSLGLVQPLYIVPVHDVFVTSIVPKIYYTGPYPRRPLSNQEFDDFVVHLHVTVQFVVHDGNDTSDNSSSNSTDVDYVLLARSDFTSGITAVPIHRSAQNEKNPVEVTVNWTVTKDMVDLWWPINMGQQPLYKLQVAIAWNATGATTNGNDDKIQQYQSSWMERRIGFRTLALVTVNDTNDDIVDDLLHSHPPNEGTGEHGMYIRINGAVVSSRGANVIPMDQLEGRWSDLGHRRMVGSAAEMGMNMLRVWGGGGVLPLAFYNACDEHGILLYHDLMFVLEQNHGASLTDDLVLLQEEVQHIVQKLAHHPSIVLYAGCNECLAFYGTIDAYESLLTTLTQVDDTRAIWPVSPSRAGWKTGVHTLDGRPILGGVLKANRDNDYTKRALEEHGPYGHGGSLQFPTVNQVPSEANYTANVPPSLNTQPTGIMYPNTFVSEFGASVFSSFESMSAALPRDAWSIHGNHEDMITPTCQQDYYQVYVCNGTNDMTERNYACDNHIEAFFGDSPYNRDDIGAKSLQRQLYLCMISQTLWMKSQIETMRAENSFGLLLWQLNENWPTGGWGVIEYGPQPGMTGQVVGGRWKPVAYLLRDVLYRPVFAACGESALCYVRNDNIYSIDAIVKIEAWSLRESKMVATHNHKVHLNHGPGWTKQFRLPQLVMDHADVALIRVENDQSGELLMNTSVFLWRPPKSMPALSLPVGFVYDVRARGKRSEHATIRIQSDRLCLYVVLSTELEGHFSNNVLHLRPNQVVEVDFETADGATVNVDVLRRTLRIEHLGSFHRSIDGHQRPPQWPTSLARDVREAKMLLGLRMFYR